MQLIDWHNKNIAPMYSFYDGRGQRRWSESPTQIDKFYVTTCDWVKGEVYSLLVYLFDP